MKYITHKDGLFPQGEQHKGQSRHYLEYETGMWVDEDGFRDKTLWSKDLIDQFIRKGVWILVDERPEFM